ncbi:MAG TPA: hypothetical protein PK349_02750 [Candidatus Hydrogenedentes bacterium]|nr:hypothetical protein [Candidatus Hydrogenedentota bacterium]
MTRGETKGKRRRVRVLTARRAASPSTGQLLMLLMQLLDILAPAWLAKEGIGQSGG